MTQELYGPLALEHDAVYRARVRLSGVLQCAVSNESVADAFASHGFRAVRCWALASELPADWPADEKEIYAGLMECGRWLEGTWDGPDSTVPRPPELIAIWLHGQAGTPAAKPAPGGEQSCPSDVAKAARILAAAWTAEVGGALSASGLQWLLGQSLIESNWGCSKYHNGALTQNNWGSMHCPLDPEATADCRKVPGQADCIVQRVDPREGELWSGFVMGEDSTDHKHYHPVAFRTYTSAELGARDFVRKVAGYASAALILNGTALAISEALKAKHYFGVSADEYAKAIFVAAQQSAQQLKQPMALRYSISRGTSRVLIVGASTMVLAAAAGGIVWWRRRRKRAA